MPSFVSSIVTEVTSTTQAFLLEIFSTYWLTILGVIFVGGMIGLFWGLAHKIFGKRLGR